MSLRALPHPGLLFWGLYQLLRHGGRPNIVLGFRGGIGDDLLCTVAVDEWLRRGTQRVWFITRHPELYAHYDARVRLLPDDERFVALAERLGRPFRALSYSTYESDTDREIPPAGHIIATMCRLAGLSGRVALQPDLRLYADELARAAPYQNVIVVQTGNLVARVPMRNKQWRPGRFAAVGTELLRRGLTVVQLGATQDEEVPGAVDLRGATSLRESAAILAGARLFVGPVGFLMHLARAVSCPGVIVYGGREIPAMTGYPANENLVRPMPCAPCWQRNRCAHDHACMDDITARDVLNAIDRRLALPRGPLRREEVTL